MSYSQLIFAIIYVIFLVVAPFTVDAIEIYDPLGGKTIPDIINAIAIALQPMALAVAIVLIIISGIQYLTSAGSEEKITRAKKTMLWTIIGLAIVLMASFIVQIVFEFLGITNGS